MRQSPALLRICFSYLRPYRCQLALHGWPAFTIASVCVIFYSELTPEDYISFPGFNMVETSPRRTASRTRRQGTTDALLEKKVGD
jgi:hypothetical protein